MRILAIDDEPIFCDLLTTRLEQLGYTNVETAFNGPDALAIAAAKTKPIECFIVDIRMMPMDGIELVRRLRAIPHHQATPIVMLSALTDKASIDAAFMAGALAFAASFFVISIACDYRYLYLLDVAGITGVLYLAADPRLRRR